MKQAIRQCVFWLMPAYRQEVKRVKLSRRLHRVFFMDALEGSLDVIVRAKYRKGV